MSDISAQLIMSFYQAAYLGVFISSVEDNLILLCSVAQ